MKSVSRRISYGCVLRLIKLLNRKALERVIPLGIADSWELQLRWL